jgi:hypothetical protein
MGSVARIKPGLVRAAHIEEGAETPRYLMGGAKQGSTNAPPVDNATEILVNAAHAVVEADSRDHMTEREKQAISAHLCVTLSAGAIARYLARRPEWLSIQRYVMASVLSAIAVTLAFEHRRRV